MLREAGGAEEHVTKARELGLGLFVRSLVGLNREAAKQAFATFLTERGLRANQIEFVNLVIDYLTEHGAMEPAGATVRNSPSRISMPRGVEGSSSLHRSRPCLMS